MATHKLWTGIRSPAREEYEVVNIEGEEIFAITFDDENPPVDYRVFETAKGNLVVYYIEKRDGGEVGGIDVYESLADFLMKELKGD